MDTSLLLQYGWVLVVLIGLEVVLSADNAVVMAVMVKGLKPENKKGIVLWSFRSNDSTIQCAICYFIASRYVVCPSIRCCLPNIPCN